MSWMQKLCETYDNCQGLIGVIDGDDDIPLMPVAHTTQVAQIEITLDIEGNWVPHGSKVLLDKKEAVTIVPCTEASQSRSGKKPTAHPLFDKLQYLAGDYEKFGGEKGSSFHEEYMSLLHEWCTSNFAYPPICAVENYLKKNTLINDLVQSGCLAVDNENKVMRAWKGEEDSKPEIFKTNIDPLNAFVRVKVLSPNHLEDRLWADPEAWNSFIEYYESTQDENGLCYVSGLAVPCSDKSPSKIRSTADKAKLISSNDNQGITYLGRFESAEQAMNLGYLTSQKAHNALKWLISRQSYRNNGLVYVAWNTENGNVLCPLTSSEDWIDQYNETDDEVLDTRQEYSKRLVSAMKGYSDYFDDDAGIVIMGIDSAISSTTGRLSVLYYRELRGSDLKDRIIRWYESCCWILPCKKETSSNGTTKTIPLRLVGAPSLKDMAFAAYGGGADKKLVSNVIKRIAPCIIDDIRIPHDLVSRAAARACNPIAMERWEYDKTLAVACALIRKERLDEPGGEEWNVELETESPQGDERSYIFGRILAYYDYFERAAKLLADEKVKDTNAMRLMSQFKRKPASVANRLQDRTRPYCKRLRSNDKSVGRYIKLEKELYALIDRLKGETESVSSCNFNDEPLGNLFLLGYASQLNELYTK